MTLPELIHKASEVYDNRAIQDYFEDDEGEHGDTLALFIARELRDTFDPKATDEEQCAEALRVMKVAQLDLDKVIAAFE